MIRLDYEFKLEDSSDRLFGLEVEMEEEESLRGDQQAHSSTPPDQTTPPASRDGETRSQQRELLMAECKQLYKEYRKTHLPFPSLLPPFFVCVWLSHECRQGFYNNRIPNAGLEQRTSSSQKEKSNSYLESR